MTIRTALLALLLLPPAQDELGVSAIASGTDAPLRAVAFADADTGWCVGARGTVLKTTDGGRTWNRIAVDTDADLTDVSFHGKEAGWIVGSGGTTEQLPQKVRDYWAHKAQADMEILQYMNMGHFLISRENPLPHPTVIATTDGGGTWAKKQVLKTNFKPIAVQATGPAAAWFATFSDDHGDGDLWGTRNGGAGWTIARTWRNIYDFQMLDADRGWAVGEPEGYLGRQEDACGLLKIARGGRYTRVVHDFAAKEAVMSLSFVTADLGWVVTEQGSIYRTADGGKTFERQHGPPPPDKARGARSMGHVYDKKIDYPYHAIRFRDADRGIAVGRAGLLYTLDGGRTWTAAKLVSKPHLLDVAFVSGDTAVAVGEDGAILLVRLPAASRSSEY